MNLQDMEGYKELMDKMLDTLPAEQVLSHCAPEQRLAGLLGTRSTSTPHVGQSTRRMSYRRGNCIPATSRCCHRRSRRWS